MEPGDGMIGGRRPRQEEDRSALITLAMALSCIGLFAHGFDSPLGQTLSCLLGSAALLMLTIIFRPSIMFWRYVRWPCRLFVAGLAWLVIVATARATTAFNASDLPYAPDLFLAKFLSVVAGLWFLMIGAIIGQRQAERRLAINWIILFITVFATSGMILVLFPNREMFQTWSVVDGGRLLGLTGNANVTASLCGAGAVLCVSAGLKEWVRCWRGRDSFETPAMSHGSKILIAAFLLNFAALIFTASRVAVVVTGLSLVLLFVHRDYAHRQSLRTIAQRVAATGGVVLIIILLFSNVLVQRATLIGPDALARWTIWAHFFDIARSVPLTGLGPGAFPQANIYFLQNSTAALRETWIINSPHSILLQLWFAGGLPYLCLMMGGAALILRDIIARLDLRHCGSRDVGLILASAVIMAVGLIDIPLDVTASADIALLLVGLAWTTMLGEQASPSASGAS